jgi:LacI family transcriptional regulator
MANIKDVAKLAKVSPAAVSLVLNDKYKGQISKKNQENILKAVKQLGYRPNEMARSLIRRKSNILELVIPKGDSMFSTFFFSQIVDGIWNVAQREGYTLMLHINEPYKDESQDSTRLKEGLFSDGLLVLLDETDPHLISRLRQKGIPFVLINESAKNANCVTVDYEGGARIATEHLIKLGHKKICCVRGDLTINSDRQRLAGYKAALRKYNLKIYENLIVEGGFSERKSFEAVKKLLTDKIEFTGLFGISDIMAIGAMKAIQQADLRIPEDISVVGFDDIILSSYTKPALTTAKVPMIEIGKEAAKALIEDINKSGRRKTGRLKRILKTTLVVRESSGHYGIRN